MEKAECIMGLCVFMWVVELKAECILGLCVFMWVVELKAECIMGLCVFMCVVELKAKCIMVLCVFMWVVELKADCIMGLCLSVSVVFRSHLAGLPHPADHQRGAGEGSSDQTFISEPGASTVSPEGSPSSDLTSGRVLRHLT